MKKLILSLFLFAIACIPLKAQVKIGNNPNTINANSILELESTTKGLLIPRMTTSERNALVSPPNGLQIFNTTTNMLNIYRLNQWVEGASTNPLDNLVHVYSTSDLPTPSGGAITLDATKMYVFTGIINISPNFINLNGANLRGNDPSRDGVMSSVSGGILRSSNVSVFMENFAVIPLSAGTKAYDFTDATGTKFCNIFSGCSVVEIVTPSLGVGQISGFNATTIENNYWNCKDGIKLTGTVGKFCLAYTFITNLSSGAGVEFLAGLTINDIDLSNNYFIYTGQTGVKLNLGATIDRGRMTTNMFRGVTTTISGFNSYTPAWEMRQNTGIPNTRALGSLFMTNNATTTNLTNVSTFYKIAGATTGGTLQRFSTSNNRLTYSGLESITGKILVIVGAKSSSNNSDFTIAIAKNGTVVNTSTGSMAAVNNNQSFQIILSTEVDLLTNDYIEVFIRTNNGNASSIAVEELHFKLTD
ncbi:MAG: hypothetical protein ACK44D_06665 [Bacteroidia bacterium]